jgi:hypothetical protein
MKVRIYAAHCNRPEFITFQHESIRAHVKDDWDYIVVNDAIDILYHSNLLEPDMRQKIERHCQEIGIPCLNFPQELHNHRELLFPNVQILGNNPSTRASDVYQWTLQHALANDSDDLVVILDGDMFFIEDISLVNKMGSANLAYFPQRRETIEYPWLNLVMFYPKRTPNIADFSYDCGTIQGIQLDSGGLCYNYLQANKETLKIRYISQDMIEGTEQNYIFPSHLASWMDKYASFEVLPEMFSKFEFLDHCILHYGGGSNWHSDPVLFHQIKTKTMLIYFGRKMFG